MSKILRLVVSGKSIQELKTNMKEALAELSGQETTADSAGQEPHFRTATETLKLREEQFRSPQVVSHTASIPSPAVDLPPVITPPPAASSSGYANMNYGVDSMGIPWDERIHSVSAAKNKDGSWRTRRGVEPTFVQQVEHELIAKIKAGGGVAEAPTFPPAFVQPTFVPPAPSPVLQPLQASPQMIPPLHTPAVPLGNLTAPAPAAPQPMVPSMAAPSIVTPAAPVAPPPPVQAPVTSAHSVQTFIAQFVPTLSFLVAEGKITNEYVAALKNYFKLEQIYDANDEQKAVMFETFCTAGLLTKVG